MTNEPISLAPKSMTTEHVHCAAFHLFDCIMGLGRQLASYEATARQLGDDSPGWEGHSYFDHDAADYLYNEVVTASKTYAKVNALFYNTDLLEREASRMCVEAFADGFNAEEGITGITAA